MANKVSPWAPNKIAAEDGLEHASDTEALVLKTGAADAALKSRRARNSASQGKQPNGHGSKRYHQRSQFRVYMLAAGEIALDFLAHWFGSIRLQHLNPFDSDDDDEDPVRKKAIKDLDEDAKGAALRSNFKTVRNTDKVRLQMAGKVDETTGRPMREFRAHRSMIKQKRWLKRSRGGKLAMRLGNKVVKRPESDTMKDVQFIDTSLHFAVSGAITSVRFYVKKIDEDIDPPSARIKFQVYRHVKSHTFTLINETIAIISNIAGVTQLFTLQSPLTVEAGDYLGWSHPGIGIMCYEEGGNVVRWRHGLEPVGTPIDFDDAEKTGWSRRTYSYEVTYMQSLDTDVNGKPQGWPGMGWGGPPIIIDREWDEFRAAIEREPVLERQYLPVFICLQCLMCFFLYAYFRIKDGSNEAGFDSIWPGDTDLAVQYDCEDWRLEIWRWWTYQYTHVGWMHVIFNVCLALFYGVSLEGMHGYWRMFIMFQVGVFGGACCYFVVDVHTRVVGMSGGVYALLGMQFGDIIMNYSEQKVAAERFQQLPDEEKSGLRNLYRKGIFHPLVKIVVLTLLTVLDVLQAHLVNGAQTSHAAHFGGGVAGLLIAIVVGNNRVWRAHERILWVLAFLGGIGLVIFCLGWLLGEWPPMELFDQVRWCWARQVNNITVFGDNDWHCVRCDGNACINRWSQQTNIARVSTARCSDLGGWAISER